MSELTLVVRPALGGIRLAAHVVDTSPAALSAEDSDTEEFSAPSGAGRRGIWALADQGAVSLGNCATNVFLARGLAVHEFGVFAILLEAMIFLNALQAALVIYPLSVRGSIMDNAALRRLAGACLLLTVLMGLPLGLAVITAAGMVSTLGIGILAVLALLLWQCQETLRRAMMSQGGQKQALPGDIISYIGQAGGMLILSRLGMLHVGSAFAVMAITSAAAVLVQAIQIGPRLGKWSELRETAIDFWQLGRWVMFGNFTLIITTLGCSWTLAYFHGTDAVGKFQALANLLKLSNPLTICMAGLIVPAAARAFRTRGLDSARKVTLRYGLLTTGVLAPYYLTLIVLPTTAIHLLYGFGSAYSGLGNQLRTFVVWYGALLVAQIAGSFLNAIEQSRRSFYAQVAQTAAVVLITLPLTAIYGLDGLMLGGVIGNIVMAASYISLARRYQETVEEAHQRFVTHEMQESSKIAA